MEILRQVDAERIRDLREHGELFWLDLTAPAAAELEQLGGLIAIHPLALEDSQEFSQRVKLDDYAHSALLVVYGAEPSSNARPQLVEVHLHLTADGLVTVRQEPLTALSAARNRVESRPPEHRHHAVYEVLDALADSIVDSLDEFDDAIDQLQAALIDGPTPAHRRRIFELRRQLAELRRVVLPECELLASPDDLLDAIPGSEHEGARHRIRDIGDHLNRSAGLIGSYRDQISGLLDLYLAEVSNGMNEVMKRLTVIATVFLPLMFLTGFFGMNFGWLVKAITPTWTFPVFGVGLLAVSTAAIAFYLGRVSRD